MGRWRWRGRALISDIGDTQISDNTLLNAGSGGNTIRTLDDGSVHWPVGVAAYATSVGTPDVLTIPVAAALADNTANPTTLLEGSCVLWYDGTTWDRARGDSTDGLLVNLGANNDVVVTNAGTFAVQAAQSGTWNITNISGTVSLPTGAATAAKQPALGTAGSASADVITVQGIASMTALKVDGSAVTQPVSAASLPLPSGASTAAKQPALGTAGTASTDVITIQGIASMTAVKVDGSAVTQPISDASGSLTVDAPVGTPVFVRLSDGASAISTLPVSLASVPSHAVTNAGTFAVQIDGAALTSLQLLDDAVSGTGFNISQMNGVAVTMGNGASGTGVQRVTIANDSTGILAGVTTVTTVTTVATLTGGGIAHDGVDSGNPHKIGAKSSTSLSGVTLVANADRTDLYAGVDGVLIVRTHCNLEDVVQERTTNTDGASTAFASGLAAPGAGVRLWITSIDICNSSAAFCTVDIRDGVGGSVLWTLPVPATGGVCKIFDPPLKITANTALAFDASAATSTLTISVNGFKSKV